MHAITITIHHHHHRRGSQKPHLLLWERGKRMGKKLELSSLLYKLRDTRKPSSSWLWPSCSSNPRTDSFREGEAMYRTVNSVYFDSAESCFTRTSEEGEEERESLSTPTSEDSGAVTAEKVARAPRSDRLLFESAGRSGGAGSLVPGAAEAPFEDSVALAMESEDPYGDFRRSMEEMVTAHGLTEWKKLEELLIWYLMVNGKKTHGYIVGAFADLLVALATPTPPCSSSSSNSVEIEETKEEEENLSK